MKLRECDNDTCAEQVRNDDDYTVWWLRIGYPDGPTFDACSPSCVMAIVASKDMGKR